jgi:hypothetical protein
MPVPKKRLVVFASVKDKADFGAMDGAQTHLEQFGVEAPQAIMSSYWAIRSSYDYAVGRMRAWDKCKHRFLDSGAFTFINAAQKGKAFTLEKFREFADAYVQAMKDHGDDWDHVVEMDVDDVFGREVAQEYRRKLRDIVGDRLLPVWHETNGLADWKELISEFPYVGIGSNETRTIKTQQERILLRQAHAAGVRVHRFGTSSPFFMREVPYDTCDSTGWLAGQRFAQYGQIRFSPRIEVSPRELRKTQELEGLLNSIGFDRKELWRTGALVSRRIACIYIYTKLQETLPTIKLKHSQPLLLEEPT